MQENPISSFEWGDGNIRRMKGCGYALQTELHCIIWKHCGGSSEHLVVHHSPTFYSSGFAGQCFMMSARSQQGVAVVGACKEKGGSLPLPPSLPLDPSLFCSPCSSCLSLLSLTACNQHSFSVIPPLSDSLYSQSVLSITLWKRAASCVQLMCTCVLCMHVCKCRSLFFLIFCADCQHVETWLNIK